MVWSHRCGSSVSSVWCWAQPLGHYCLNYQPPDAGNMEIFMEFGTAAAVGVLLEAPAGREGTSYFAIMEPGHAGSAMARTTCSKDTS